MNNSAINLPQKRKDELATMVNLIKEKASVEMIILFGSYARGDWVNDMYTEGHVIYDYKSDYDLLIVVEGEELKQNITLWKNLESEISTVTKLTVNLIVDTIDFVNKKIQESNYFYLDIKNEGVVLYDSSKFTLATPLGRSKELLQADFDFWYQKSLAFYKDFKHNIVDNELNNGAFHLSQLTESLYFAVLVVIIGYKPKSHGLEKIIGLAEKVAPALEDTFLMDTVEHKHNFELLKRAYIDARYKQDYKITLEQLTYLEKRINILFDKVKMVCEDFISKY